MKFISESEKDTFAIGARLSKTLSPGNVVAFFGDLGSGKTVFVRGMADGLKLSSRVSSPTFTIVNEYLGDLPLFHFDMYRISSSEELFDLGWEDYLNRGGICAVEWSENIKEALPENTIIVTFKKTGDNSREITIDGWKDSL